MKSLIFILCALALSAEAAPRSKARKPSPAAAVKKRKAVPTPPPVVQVDPEPLVEAAPQPEPPEPIEIKFSKSLNLDGQGLFYPDALSPHVGGQGFGILKGELNTSLRVGRALQAKFRPTGTWDPANKSESEQYWIEVPEGYTQLRLALGEVATSYTQVGWNIFTWGVTDGFNPVDVVNARRFHDPLRSEKLGAFSIVEKVDFDGFLVEGIFIPRQRKSLLPASHSRWLPRDMPREQFQDGVTYRLSANNSFYYRENLEYDNALENNFGLRLGLKALGIDMAGYYFHGASTVPATNLKITGAVVALLPTRIIEAGENDPIGIRPIYYKNDVYGASMVFPLADFLIRAEGAYTKPTRMAASIPVSSTETVLEIERTFAGEKQSVTLIGLLTWANHEDPEGSNSSTSLTRMFDRGIALGARYQPMESISTEGFAVIDTVHGGHLLKMEATKVLTDRWKVYGGSEIFAGKNTTPIGRYRKNDRFWAGLRLAL